MHHPAGAVPGEQHRIQTPQAKRPHRGDLSRSTRKGELRPSARMNPRRLRLYAGQYHQQFRLIPTHFGEQSENLDIEPNGRISDLLKILLAYFTFSWKKDLHVVAGDLSGTNDIAGSTRMVAWVDRGA